MIMMMMESRSDSDTDTNYSYGSYADSGVVLNGDFVNGNASSSTEDISHSRTSLFDTDCGLDEDDEDDNVAAEDDLEHEELARLRCGSVQTEVLADRHRRRNRRNRNADYPGLAFGSSIFSSNTLMKFNVISNELHNIMNVQLKRVRTFRSNILIKLSPTLWFFFLFFPPLLPCLSFPPFVDCFWSMTTLAGVVTSEGPRVFQPIRMVDECGSS